MIYDEIEKFYGSYGGPKCVLGSSVGGRRIFAVHAGEECAKRQLIAVYAVHGREWITARLALEHAARGTGGGWGCWMIPLLNPDGAEISQAFCPMWKANLRGVDLNCNFDADWGGGASNTRVRGSENCVGDRPFSEPETKSLRAFTVKVAPRVTLSFHTKGGEIYWEFAGGGDRRGADILAEATGYVPRLLRGSSGGYKDWCIYRLGIPAYTIECGADRLSHPIKDVNDIKECFGALKFFTERYER